MTVDINSATVAIEQIDNFIDDDFEYEEYLPEEQALEVQRQINALHYWRFEGHVGRTLIDFIDAGWCLLGHADTRDYYGNHIPSRDQVQPGTKGSYEYVAAARGKEWADIVAAIA